MEWWQWLAGAVVFVAIFSIGYSMGHGAGVDRERFRWEMKTGVAFKRRNPEWMHEEFGEYDDG